MGKRFQATRLKKILEKKKNELSSLNFCQFKEALQVYKILTRKVASWKKIWVKFSPNFFVRINLNILKKRANIEERC
jgi:hypothetical protein